MAEKSGWQKWLERVKKMFGAGDESAATRPKSRDELAAEIFHTAPQVQSDRGSELNPLGNSGMWREPGTHKAVSETVPLTSADQEAQKRWQQAMPICLSSYWEAMMNNLDTLDYTSMRIVMMEEYPDPTKRALALFAWYGQGSRTWDEYPQWETVPEQFLMEIPLNVLVEALEENPLANAHLEGAARLFSGPLFSGLRGHELPYIPAALKEAFVEHVTAQGDKAKIARVRQIV